jgi:hypothetical protein
MGDNPKWYNAETARETKNLAILAAILSTGSNDEVTRGAAANPVSRAVWPVVGFTEYRHADLLVWLGGIKFGGYSRFEVWCTNGTERILGESLDGRKSFFCSASSARQAMREGWDFERMCEEIARKGEDVTEQTWKEEKPPESEENKMPTLMATPTPWQPEPEEEQTRKEEKLLEPEDQMVDEGAFPIRQDSTVLPADDPKKMRLGWVIYEEIGIVVVNNYAAAKITVSSGS